MKPLRLLLLLLCLQPALLSAAPRVVTSIAPLQELAAALMTGVAEPETIIDDQGSPHHFAFKPSQLRRLQQADLVIWVDRHFEAGFNRMPEILPASVRQLELLPALGSEDRDGHIWYSPTLLQQSIDIIAAELARLDPGNQARYRGNAKTLASAVTAWGQRLLRRWQGSRPRILADHAFLENFLRDLPMFEIAFVQDSHAAPASLRALGMLEKWLREKPAACLLSLESPEPLATSLAHKFGLRVVDIKELPAGTLVQRLERLEAALESCVTGAPYQ